jgi:hypothetical protein
MARNAGVSRVDSVLSQGLGNVVVMPMVPGRDNPDHRRPAGKAVIL